MIKLERNKYPEHTQYIVRAGNYRAALSVSKDYRTYAATYSKLVYENIYSVIWYKGLKL